jgi:hypothetical protein
MNSLVDDSGNAQVWIGRSSLLWELDLSPLSGFPRTFWSFSLIFLSTPSYFDFFRKREASSNDELSYRRPRPAFPYTFLPCHIFSFSLFSLSISLLYLWLWSFVGAFVGARHRVMWKCYDRPTKVSSVFFSFHVYRFFRCVLLQGSRRYLLRHRLVQTYRDQRLTLLSASSFLSLYCW